MNRNDAYLKSIAEFCEATRIWNKKVHLSEKIRFKLGLQFHEIFCYESVHQRIPDENEITKNINLNQELKAKKPWELQRWRWTTREENYWQDECRGAERDLRGDERRGEDLVLSVLANEGRTNKHCKRGGCFGRERGEKSERETWKGIWWSMRKRGENNSALHWRMSESGVGGRIEVREQAKQRARNIIGWWMKKRGFREITENLIRFSEPD